MIFILIYMVYIFRRKLITSSLIKNTGKQVSTIGVIQKVRHSQNLVFGLISINFLLLLSYVTFPNFFVKVCFHPFFLNDSYFWHIMTFALTKLFFFRSIRPFVYGKYSSSKSFWKLPSKTSIVEFFLDTLAGLSGSFPKSCLEQIFCREPAGAAFL